MKRLVLVLFCLSAFVLTNCAPMQQKAADTTAAAQKKKEDLSDEDAIEKKMNEELGLTGDENFDDPPAPEGAEGEAAPEGETAPEEEAAPEVQE